MNLVPVEGCPCGATHLLPPEQAAEAERYRDRPPVELEVRGTRVRVPALAVHLHGGEDAAWRLGPQL